jgi:GAF domain-containing protein
VDERSSTSVLDDRESIWASALHAAAGVARQAAFSEQDVLRSVTEELRRLRLRGGVSLLRPDGKLEIRTRSLSQSAERALQRLSGKTVEGFSFDPQQVDLYRQALATGEAAFAPDRTETVRQMTPGILKNLLPRIMRLLGSDPLIVSPLILSGKPIGAINVSALWLTPRDLPMMNALADHIAISISNARTQENLHRALEREQLRHQVVEAVTSALDLPSVLERVLRLAAEATDADAGVVAILDPGRPHPIALPPAPSRWRGRSSAPRSPCSFRTTARTRRLPRPG